MINRPNRVVIALTLLLTGCGDLYDQPGTWHAVNVNQANLDGEVVSKVDTVAGHGRSGSDAVLDTAAVTRLYQDKAKPLKSEATTTGVAGGTGGS